MDIEWTTEQYSIETGRNIDRSNFKLLLAILSFSGKIPRIDQSQVNNLQPRSLKVKPSDFLMIDNCSFLGLHLSYKF